MTWGGEHRPDTSRRPEDTSQMIRPADRVAHRLSWRSRIALVGLLLVVLLVLTAAAPASVLAPHLERAISGASASAPTAQAVVEQSDPEQGIILITAVYNSIQDRFFRPLDSRDMLDAAWEGATRGLAEQRRNVRDVPPPQLTGDRAGDLAAFVTQYRALLASAGTSVDANRVAMAASDLMTQSVNEQHTVFLTPDQFSRFRASLTSDEGRVGLGILIQGQAAPFVITSVVPGAPAEKAGVLEGDEIQAVDGQDVRNADLRGLSDALRGEEGQPVTLTVSRSGQPVNVTVVRARFSEPPLSMRAMPEGVCYLHLSTFPVSFVVGPTGRTIGQELDYDLERCEQAGAQGW